MKLNIWASFNIRKLKFEVALPLPESVKITELSGTSPTWTPLEAIKQAPWRNGRRVIAL